MITFGMVADGGPSLRASVVKELKATLTPRPFTYSELFVGLLPALRYVVTFSRFEPWGLFHFFSPILASSFFLFLVRGL